MFSHPRFLEDLKPCLLSRSEECLMDLLIYNFALGSTFSRCIGKNSRTKRSGINASKRQRNNSNSQCPSGFNPLAPLVISRDPEYMPSLTWINFRPGYISLSIFIAFWDASNWRGYWLYETFFDIERLTAEVLVARIFSLAICFQDLLPSSPRILRGEHKYIQFPSSFFDKGYPRRRYLRTRMQWVAWRWFAWHQVTVYWRAAY